MAGKPDRERYLAYARSLTDAEKRSIAEFSDWLPNTIIDCHAHCNLPEHVQFINDRALKHVISSFPSYSLEESKEWHARLFPGKKIFSLRFPNAFRGIDHRAANLYLLEQSATQDRVAIYGLPDDPDYTLRILEHPRASALKMYYSYLEPPATEIYQYFPKIVLGTAQEKGVPVILHPPAKITACLDQILKLVKDFPRLRICLAHLSLTKNPVPGLEEAFAAIAGCPFVNFDTALVPSAEIVAMALQIVGPDRIMYGSDEPLNLIRSVPYIHSQRGERLATEHPYHWVDAIEHQEYKHLTKGVVHAHWYALQAIKTAVAVFPRKDHEEIKQKLFYSNANMFYGFGLESCRAKK